MMTDSSMATSQEVLLENLRRMAESLSSSTPSTQIQKESLLQATKTISVAANPTTATPTTSIIEEAVKKAVMANSGNGTSDGRLYVDQRVDANMNGTTGMDSESLSSSFNDDDDNYVYDDEVIDFDEEESQGSDIDDNHQNKDFHDRNTANIYNNFDRESSSAMASDKLNKNMILSNNPSEFATVSKPTAVVSSLHVQEPTATNINSTSTAISPNTANNNNPNTATSDDSAMVSKSETVETSSNKPKLDGEGEAALICSECGTEFTDVQSYMSHGCIQSSEESNDARNSSKNKFETENSQMDVDIPSDAESFDGKIVYNPDGSAYIIEGTSDLSETESMFDGPNKEGVIIDHKGKVNTSQVPSFPQIASAYYIQKNPAFYNAWYSMLPPENRPRTEAPIMHSYRVFDVRTGKTESLMESELPKAAKAVDLKSGDITSVPTKPILMCFICKLSFGYTKSFVSHALAEHSMNLNDEEKCYLSRKNASAIIQGIGKSKNPLMSFLEPISPSLNKEDGLPNSFIPKGMLSSKLKSTAATNSTNVSFVYSGSKVTPVEQKSSSTESNTSPKLNNLHTAVMNSRYLAAGGSDPLALLKQTQAQGEYDMDIGEDGDDSLSSSDNLHSFNNSSFSLKSPAARILSAGDSSPMKRDGSLNLSMNKLQHHHLSPSSANSPGSSSGPPPLMSPQPGLSSTPTSLSPKMSLPNIPIPPLVPVTSTAVNPNGPVQGIVIRAGCEDHPNGNITGDECLKCESVLGTARIQMGQSMTMMHSRNSCKTLKCPKCNWHYKYQETLEIHMKEKHPENDTQCIYCIAKQPHPRLARGEVYTCGYKPYRCEVCNYSTTTKGNLSIHMQSDKHINNMQELQKAQASGGGGPNQPQTHQQPPTTPNGGQVCHLSPISSGNIEVQIPPTTPPISSSPAASMIINDSVLSAAAAAKNLATAKPKPSWRCDVCNYETNVARNLRIHMTSEKHTHNMMMLQQNVKHMQRDMHFQMNPMAFMGQDPGMMFGLPGPLGPGLPPFPFDPSMLMAPGMPNPVPADGPMDLTKPEADHVGSKSMDLKNNNEPSKLFQCAICEGYSADSLESLHAHMQLDRTKHGNEEHVTVINGTYICNLCQYKTNLKANFQLHCKTDKHLQRLQLVNHIREASRNMKDNEWQMKYFANISNPVQVRCSACNYYTNSIHKLQLHNSTPRHEANAKLFMHLLKQENEVKGEKKYYRCNLCKANLKSKLGLIEHVKTMNHMRNESIKILQLQEMGKEIEFNAETIFIAKELQEDREIQFEEDVSPHVSFDPEIHSELGFRTTLPNDIYPLPLSSASGIMHLPSSVTTPHKDEAKDLNSEKLYSCQYCRFNSASEDRLQIHIQTAHEAFVPKEMACPLCQEKYLERSKIENHLVEVHNVSKEGLQRLMVIFDSQPANSSCSNNNTTKLTSSSTATSSGDDTIKSSSSSNVRQPTHISPVTTVTATVNGPLFRGSPAETVSKPPEAELASSSSKSMPSSMMDDGQGMEDGGDPMAEMMEMHALKLAEEASKDGIVLNDSTNKDQTLESQYRCQTCSKTFQNIDNLYNHQNELGHLELKQTPRGPGYLCWKKGCNQYFKTAQALQVHFREIHAKKPPSNMSISEKHAYKYRCTQCSLAFKTFEKLQLHSYYHIIRNATMCFMCSRRFKTIGAMRKHVEVTHLDTMTSAEKEKYAQNLQATAPLALLGLPGMESGGVIMPQNPALQALQAFQQGFPMSLPLPMPMFPAMPNNISMSSFLNQQAVIFNQAGDNTPSLESPGKIGMKDNEVITTPNRNSSTPVSSSNSMMNHVDEMENDENSKDSIVDESINTIALAENSFNDPSKKYRCFRCKVAFVKQNLLIQHNRTLMHKSKSGINNNNKPQHSPETITSTKEKLPTQKEDKIPNDSEENNSQLKCELCKEIFSDRNHLQTHLHSDSHKNKVKNSQETKENASILNGEAEDYSMTKTKEVSKITNTQIIRQNASSSSTSVSKASTNEENRSQNTTKSASKDDNKPYKCNICKVAYGQSATLDVHLSSVMHQTKAAKIEELIVTGEVDMSQPLIEKPETAPQLSPQSQEHNQAVLQEMMKQTMAVGGMPGLPFGQAGLFPGMPFMGLHGMVSQAPPFFPAMSLPDMNSSIATSLGMSLPTANMWNLVSTMGNSKFKTTESSIYTTAGLSEGSKASTAVRAVKDVKLSNTPSVTSTSASTSTVLSTASSTGTVPIKLQQTEKKDESKVNPNTCEKCNGQFNTAESLVQHQQMYCLMQMNSLRMKLHAQRSLLENIGFECVMQYNEFQQRPVKIKKEIPAEGDKKSDAQIEALKDGKDLSIQHSKMEVDEASSNNNPTKLFKDKNGNEKELVMKSGIIPEMEKSTCQTCKKQFSSIWVLKTHQEEVHKDIVSTDLVTIVADKFREDFDIKYPQGLLSENTNLDVVALVESKDNGPSSGSIKQEEPQVSKLGADLASAQAAQMMQMPMFNMIPGMLPMPLNLPMNMPPMMPVMMQMGPNPNEMMGLPGMPMLDHNMMNSQSQGSPSANSLAAQQQKRGRTRISDDQLKVLRGYFDINNSPSEEQIMKMSEQTGLPPKVIKHWFRNTLFKERQRNKDSPYNFSVPPSTQLNLEEYEKTGKVSVSQASDVPPVSQMEEPPKPIVIVPEKIMKHLVDSGNNNNNHQISPPASEAVKIEDNHDRDSITSSIGESMISSTPSTPVPSTPIPVVSSTPVNTTINITPSTSMPMLVANSGVPTSLGVVNPLLGSNFNPVSLGLGFSPLVNPLNHMVGNPLELAFAKAFSSSHSTPEKPSLELKMISSDFRRPSSSDAEMSGQITPTTPGPNGSNASFLSSRRANRTRFSDYQLKALQEYFEQNAYPKDDDLDHLSKLLGLSPRVIVVWFQNARQKARKSYENNPPAINTIEDDSKYNRTPGLNYQCKRCFTVFQRYYELIRHQKTRCYKDEDDRSETNWSSYTQDDEDSNSSENSYNRPPLSTTPKDLVQPTTPKSEGSLSGREAQVKFECEKCTAVFSRFELWKEHQSFHMLNPSLFSPLPAGSNAQPLAAAAAAAAAGVNPFAQFPPILPALPTAQQIHAHLANIKQEDMMQAVKRKYEEDEYERDEHGQKRMRTTILPEQLDYLYQQYQLDCNPSRKQLESIADHVGLKKRVVQVWFQNTRARERKGQYRAHIQLIHKRCPFCRALFRAKSAMEAHLAAKHPEEMARTQVNIDNIPDEPLDSFGSSEGGSAPTTPTPSSSSASGVPNLDMAKLLSNPYSIPNQFMPIMSGGNFDDPVQESMKQLYEESLKRYMADISGGVKEEKSHSKGGFKAGGHSSEESPLDLSKPVDLSRSLSIKEEYIEYQSGNESDDNDVHVSMTDSGPPSPCSTSSSNAVTSPHDLHASMGSGSSGSNMMNIPPKRYRTQLSALQVKIMKSIYQYYKTPTMTECEMLGRTIGLAKRVIQVWFQNARAKEKKAKSQYPNYNPELDIPTPPEQCKLCSFKYTHQYTVQDHLLSRGHIEKVSAHIKATDQDVANETTRNIWEKNEVAAMAQMNAHTAAFQGMANPAAALGLGLPGGSMKKKESDDGTNKKIKDEKHTAKKPEANSALGLPPGSAASSVAAMMNPFSGLAAGMPPGMMEMGAAAMAAQAAAGMMPFMMPPTPGAMGFPFMPPGMMPGPEMFMYDPATFGTPLTLLQIPPAAIKSVQSKLQDEGCIITRYTQDCKNLSDLKAMISANHFASASEAMVDVGFICRKCQMVYPGKEACVSHQQMMCYQGKNLPQDKTIIKLEQIQYECRVCDLKFSTLQEFQVHCDMDVHKKKMKKQ